MASRIGGEWRRAGRRCGCEGPTPHGDEASSIVLLASSRPGRERWGYRSGWGDDGACLGRAGGSGTAVGCASGTGWPRALRGREAINKSSCFFDQNARTHTGAVRRGLRPPPLGASTQTSPSGRHRRSALQATNTRRAAGPARRSCRYPASRPAAHRQSDTPHAAQHMIRGYRKNIHPLTRARTHRTQAREGYG